MQARVRAGRVVVAPPRFGHPARREQAAEQVLVQAFVAEPPLKLSTNPFCCGLLGAMLCQAPPRSCCQRRTAWEVSSVPLSLTIIAGQPHSATIRSSSRPTRSPDSDVSTTSAGSSPAAAPSAPACRARACDRRAAVSQGVPPGAGGTASCGSAGAPRAPAGSAGVHQTGSRPHPNPNLVCQSSARPCRDLRKRASGPQCSCRRHERRADEVPRPHLQAAGVAGSR